ncbi:FK506-binding protein-like [Geodia barretti]|uniref:FK506-binding protein-like n=1 Tax=Geodia barretti TaxID=519541 RepID=A0AA35R4F6_GEOBA|nr:FK506-binding protein-like [Geodia barretti]
MRRHCAPRNSSMLARRTERAGRGLRIAGEGATVVIDIVCSYGAADGDLREVERREGVEMKLGEALEPLYLVLDDALAAMREGEVCRLEPVPRALAGDLHDLPIDVVSLSYTLSLVSFTRARQLWEMETSEILSLASRHKERGGKLFQEGQEGAAAVCYSRAAKLAAAAGGGGEGEFKDLQVALGLNLAACQLKLGQADHASSNCSRVLELDPGNVKALYRRGVARMRLGDLDEAEEDLRQAGMGNTAVQRRLRELTQLKQQQSARLSQALRPMFSDSL